MQNPEKPKKESFTKYQAFVIAILAILQFTIILDFMVLSPLSAFLLDELKIIPSQFGLVVSAYAFSAGTSGLLAAGFADKFDRKKLLMFFYAGFIVGTALCAWAPTYQFLLMARIVTGLFGGVIGSISFAIITDLFKLEMRGRVMGFVQMAFAASQIFGIPVGLFLANHFGWHSPFWLIVSFSVVIWIIVFIYLKPITAHLHLKLDKNPVEHLLHTISNRDYLRGFIATVLLATGGFMLMPFGAAFSTFNMKISADELPFLYAVTGIFTMISGPILGKFADQIGKFRMFAFGTILSAIMVAIYTNLGATPLWIAIMLNVIMFIGITGRMIPAQSLLTAVPKPQDRGAFMSINSSVQQFSGGIASFVAGLIVIREPNGHLDRYDILGMVVIFAMLVAVALMYNLNRHIQKKLHAATPNI